MTTRCRLVGKGLFALGLLVVCLVTPAKAGNPSSAFYTPATDTLIWFIHASDTHLGTSGTADSINLQWLTGEAANVINPSFIMVSGDLTDSTNGNVLGYPNGPYQEEWDQYRAIVDGNGMTAGFYFDIPGNHDAYNDQAFSYFLANSVQGRANGRLQASWTRSGPWGTYHFLGVNTADNTGTPFSLTWPYGDNAGLDAAELAFIAGELNAHADSALTLVFGHHPLAATGSSTDTYLLYGKSEFLGLMSGHGTSLYGYGHTHASSEAFFTEGMSGGMLYINVSALGKDSPNQFTVTAIDGHGISSVTQNAGTWPVVLITAPVDRSLGSGVNPYAYSVTNSPDNPVRALVFAPGTITGVQFRIDGGSWQAMQVVAGQTSLWQGVWNASTLAAGAHQLEVRATTTSGTRSDVITTLLERLPESDRDGDGIADSLDNCPDDANAEQVDTDGDRQGDLCDPDDDDDTVADGEDNCPLTANAGQGDADGDDLGDVCDVCPADAANDTDGDGVCADRDNCPDDANAEQIDTDGDRQGDLCDPDDDDDTIADSEDNCPLTANAGQGDADGDDLGDACDVCPADAANDTDGDGVCADADNCVDVANADQADADGDLQGNACDADDDGDGLADVSDNCPLAVNPGQDDSDGDGLGDACDPDAPREIPVTPALTLSTTGTRVAASWSAVTGAGRYTLHYAPIPYAGPDSIQSLDVGRVTSFAANLWDGAAFYVAVKGCNALGCSDYSNVESFAIDLPAPDPPELAFELDGMSAHVSWTPVEDADGYILFYAPYPYAGEATIGSIAMGEATELQADLWPGADYYLTVEACRATKCSGYSNVILIRVEGL